MKPELAISLAATVTSICAFAVTLWQGWVTRKHNRLSVLPILHFNLGAVGDDYVLSLKNTGVGPAIIEKCVVYFNDKEVVGNPNEIANKLFEELEVDHLGGKMYLPGEYQAMAVGEEFIVFSICDALKQPDVKNRIANDILWLKILVSYNSVYGDSFEVYAPHLA